MSLLKRLFSKELKLPPADYAVLGTDVHSHFIPGIDDGAKTMEDSLELIRGMQEFGYKKVITTPHIMSDYYRNTPEIILRGLEQVKAALKENNIDMEIEAAAEYYIDFDLEEKIEKKELLTFGENYVLFEMPFVSEPSILGNVTFSMQTAGYKPILAHAERYTFWHRTFDKYVDMKDKGVLLQLNINSLTGFYGPDVKKIGEKLIEEGMIDLVGSDCHHMNHIQLMQDCRTQKYLHKILEKPDLLNKKL